MTAVAIPDAATLDAVAVAALADELVAWSRQTDDVAAVTDAAHRWAAITEYVRRTSRTGLAAAEAALRRLEVRIGELLGPATRDHDRSPGAKSVTTDIDRHQRDDFRTLAEHADVVEQVIAGATDTRPPSRRACLTTIADQRDRAETDAINAEIGPRIAAALATLEDDGLRDWRVVVDITDTHPDDVTELFEQIGQIVSITENPR